MRTRLRTRLGLELFEDRTVPSAAVYNTPALAGSPAPGENDPGEDELGLLRSEFILGGVPGAVWYDISSVGVDTDAPEAIALLTDFRLELGGQVFTGDTPGFSPGDPVAVLSYGVVQYIRFQAVFEGPVAGFVEVIADVGEGGATEVTGYYAGEKQPPAKAPVVDTSTPRVSLDFARMQFPAMGTMEWSVGAWLRKANGDLERIEVFPAASVIPANATPSQVRDVMAVAYASVGLTVVEKGETKLEVSAPAGSALPIGRVAIFTNAAGRGLTGPSGIGIKGTAGFAPDFKVNPE